MSSWGWKINPHQSQHEKHKKTDLQWPARSAMLSNNRGMCLLLCTTVRRWETLLHTNCAHSAGPALRMAVITPTRALFTRSSCELWSCQPSIPSNRWTGRTGNYIIMMPARPPPPMIPIVSHQSALARLLISIFVHQLFLPGWLTDTDLLWSLGWIKKIFMVFWIYHL